MGRIVLVFFDNMKVKMNLVAVLKTVLFDLNIGRPTFKLLGSVLELKSKKVCWDYRRKRPLLLRFLSTASRGFCSMKSIAKLPPRTLTMMTSLRTNEMNTKSL